MQPTQDLRALVVALVGFGAAIGAAAADDAPARRKTPALVLRAVAKRTRLLPFEPLCLDATITNPRDTQSQMPGAWASHLYWEYRPAGGERWMRLAAWWRPTAKRGLSPPEPIAAGQSHSARFWLYTFGFAGRALEPVLKPGRDYRLRAVVVSSWKLKMTLTSNELELTLRPAPAAEQKALSRLLAEAKAHRWHGGLFSLLPENAPQGRETAECRLKGIEDFVEAFPKSRYASYQRRTYVLLAKRLRLDKGSPLLRRAALYQAHLREHAPEWLRVE